MLDANGLVVSALCGDLGKPGFQDKAQNAERILRSKRIMDLAKELGTNVVTTHIGVVKPNHATATKFCRKRATSLRAMAKKSARTLPLRPARSRPLC